MEKRITNIELTAEDDFFIGLINEKIGGHSTIGAIRYAIRNIDKHSWWQNYLGNLLQIRHYVRRNNNAISNAWAQMLEDGHESINDFIEEARAQEATQ